MSKRGGHNKKKGCTYWHMRYDAQCLIDGILCNQKAHEVKAGCTMQKRFVCPKCKGNVRYLYETEPGIALCRKCANLNYPIQQWSKLEFAKYKILQILQRMDVNTWEFNNWLEIIKFRPVRPDYMSEVEFFILDNELLKWKMILSNFWNKDI